MFSLKEQIVRLIEDNSNFIINKKTFIELKNQVIDEEDQDAFDHLFVLFLFVPADIIKIIKFNKINMILNSIFNNYDLEMKNNSRYLLLRMLFVIGDFETFKKITERFPDIMKTSNQDGDNLMHMACRHNNYDIYVFLFSNYPELINSPNNYGEYPIAMVKFYSGTSDSSVTSKKNIILHYLNNHSREEVDLYNEYVTLNPPENDIINLLYEIKDNKTLMTSIIKVIFRHVVKNKQYNLIQSFFEMNADSDNLMELACWFDDMNIIKIIHENGGVVKLEYLNRVAATGNIEIFKYIQNIYNFDLNQKIADVPIIFNLIQALHFCETQKGIDFLLYVLKNYDVDINIRDNQNKSIFNIIYDENIFKQNNYIVTTYLVDKGIDPYIRDNFGRCFYHYDVLKHLDVIHLHKLNIDFSHTCNDRTIICNLISEDSMELTDAEYDEMFDILIRKNNYIFEKDNKIIIDSLKNQIISYIGEIPKHAPHVDKDSYLEWIDTNILKKSYWKRSLRRCIEMLYDNFDILIENEN